MNLVEKLKQERELLQEKMHLDPLEVRTWYCDPLLVIDRSDGSVAFSANTNVEVTPRSDGTADLVAEGERDGWHPSLTSAKVILFNSTVHVYATRPGTRAGLRCEGTDKDGYRFEWHVNGAAEDYWLNRQPEFDPSVVPPEDPGD